MDPHVVAATLDPSQRNFNAAQEYLFQPGMTAVDLLSGANEQYVGDQEPPSTQQNPETTDDDVRRWKRVKQDLLSKHTVPTPSRAHEIQQFWCLSILPDNILTWWESQQKKTYPT